MLIILYLYYIYHEKCVHISQDKIKVSAFAMIEFWSFVYNDTMQFEMTLSLHYLHFNGVTCNYRKRILALETFPWLNIPMQV